MASCSLKKPPRFKLAEELFVIPDGGSYILYTPLRRGGGLMKVNGGAISALKKVGKNGGRGLDTRLRGELIRGRVLEAENDVRLDYCPTSVTLVPTLRCNLRCTYCYARGGEDTGKDMTKETAHAAIDFIVNNAIRTCSGKAHLGFHGGGEPLFASDSVLGLLDDSVRYFKRRAREEGLKEGISSATNAVCDKKILKWATENLGHLQISFDGPREIQNRQRPMANGGPSFDKVIQTIRYLEKIGFKYGIRTTITKESVGKMEEIVGFFAKTCPSVESYHLEPLFECGRCATTNEKAPSPESFITNAIKARRTAEALRKTVYYSGARLGTVHDSFCGASGTNFFVTPEGIVTTCQEVARRADGISKTFFIGKYDSGRKRFVFNTNRIKELERRTVDRIPYCDDCFAKHNCSGDCPAKILEQSGSLYDPSKNPRCKINRAILLDDMRKKLKGGKKSDKNDR